LQSIQHIAISRGRDSDSHSTTPSIETTDVDQIDLDASRVTDPSCIEYYVESVSRDFFGVSGINQYERICLALSRLFMNNPGMTHFYLPDKTHEYHREKERNREVGLNFDRKIKKLNHVHWHMQVEQLVWNGIQINRFMLEELPDLKTRDERSIFIRDHFWVSCITRDVFIRHPVLGCFFLIFKAIDDKGQFICSEDDTIYLICQEDAAPHFGKDPFIKFIEDRQHEVETRIHDHSNYMRRIQKDAARLQEYVDMHDKDIRDELLQRSRYRDSKKNHVFKPTNMTESCYPLMSISYVLVNSRQT